MWAGRGGVWITRSVSDWQAVSCECLKVCAHRQQLATSAPFAKQPSINACAILPVSGSNATHAAGGEVRWQVNLSGFLLLAAFSVHSRIENECVHMNFMSPCVSMCEWAYWFQAELCRSRPLKFVKSSCAYAVERSQKKGSHKAWGSSLQIKEEKCSVNHHRKGHYVRIMRLLVCNTAIFLKFVS